MVSAWRLTLALKTLTLLLLLATPATPAFYQFAPNPSADVQIRDAFELSSGAILYAGDARSTAWLSGVPVVALAAPGGGWPDNLNASSARVGFVLACRGDSNHTPFALYELPSGAVGGVAKIRASSRPGEPTQTVWLGGPLSPRGNGAARTSAFWLGKLDVNFVLGAPSKFVYLKALAASVALRDSTPFEVDGRGRAYYACVVPGCAECGVEIRRLKGDGAPDLIRDARLHYDASGVGREFANASLPPSGFTPLASAIGLRSVSAGANKRCGLRSWTPEDTYWRSFDGLEASKRGVWPADALQSTNCDPSSPADSGAVGYTGLSPTAAAVPLPVLAVDRRDGRLYVGTALAATKGPKPTQLAVVMAFSTDGALSWYNYLTELRDDSMGPTAHAIKSMVVDYGSSRGAGLVVLSQRGGGGRSGVEPWVSAGMAGLSGSANPLTASHLARLSLEKGTAALAMHVQESAAASTDCSHLATDGASLVYVSCAVPHTTTVSTTANALLRQSTKPVVASLYFTRAFAANFGSVKYGTLTDRPAAPPLPIAGGAVLLASRNVTFSAAVHPPSTVSWAASTGTSVLARLAIAGVVGWPVTPTTCAAGNYLHLPTPADSRFVCSNCTAGRYQNDTDQIACTACSKGSYSDATAATNSSVCQPCGIGRTSTHKASTSNATCVDCPAGKNGFGAINPTCESCPLGSFSPAGACELCPTGKAGGGAVACTDCAAGKYADVKGTTAVALCKSCPAGKYAASAAPLCTACPTGRQISTTGSTLLADCVLCVAGKYASQAGAATCKACPKGRFMDGTGADLCSACPAGTMNGKKGQTSGISACTMCQLNTFALAGADACSACVGSTYSQDGWGKCVACSSKAAVHTFAPADGVMASSLAYGSFDAAASLSFWGSMNAFDPLTGKSSAGSAVASAGTTMVQSVGPYAYLNPSKLLFGAYARLLQPALLLTLKTDLSNRGAAVATVAGVGAVKYENNGGGKAAVLGTGVRVEATLSAPKASGSLTAWVKFDTDASKTQSIFKIGTPSDVFRLDLVVQYPNIKLTVSGTSVSYNLRNNAPKIKTPTWRSVSVTWTWKQQVKLFLHRQRNGMFTVPSTSMAWPAAAASTKLTVGPDLLGVRSVKYYGTELDEATIIADKTLNEDGSSSSAACAAGNTLAKIQAERIDPEGVSTFSPLYETRIPADATAWTHLTGAYSAGIAKFMVANAADAVSFAGTLKLHVASSGSCAIAVDDAYLSIDPNALCACGEKFFRDASLGAGACIYSDAQSYTVTGMQRACPKGQVAPGGSLACRVCNTHGFCAADGGTEQICHGLQWMDKGTGKCTPCSAGYACVNSHRTRCLAGTVGDGTGHVCLACAPGRFQSASGKTSCAACPVNSSSTAGRSWCYECAHNEMSRSGGACVSYKARR